MNYTCHHRQHGMHMGKRHVSWQALCWSSPKNMGIHLRGGGISSCIPSPLILNSAYLKTSSSSMKSLHREYKNNDGEGKTEAQPSLSKYQGEWEGMWGRKPVQRKSERLGGWAEAAALSISSVITSELGRPEKKRRGGWRLWKRTSSGACTRISAACTNFQGTAEEHINKKHFPAHDLSGRQAGRKRHSTKAASAAPLSRQSMAHPSRLHMLG